MTVTIQRSLAIVERLFAESFHPGRQFSFEAWRYWLARFRRDGLGLWLGAGFATRPDRCSSRVDCSKKSQRLNSRFDYRKLDYGEDNDF